MASASGVRQRPQKGNGYEKVSHDEDAFNKYFQQDETTTVLGVELTEDEAIMCVQRASHVAACWLQWRPQQYIEWPCCSLWSHLVRLYLRRCKIAMGLIGLMVVIFGVAVVASH